jgi:hypothetical protein
MSNGIDLTGWNDEDWDRLFLMVDHDLCTPFLGAGASAGAPGTSGVLPTGKAMARDLADKNGYPFPDPDNLVRVAQFVAVKAGNPLVPKLNVIDKLKGKGPPNFAAPDEIHRAVADLNLPLYLTTNYDDFMTKALQRDAPPRIPRREVCYWNLIRRREPLPDRPPLAPTPDAPVVYHLHGWLADADSMVLTEDDYLDFLICISETQELLPPQIQKAVASTSLLFLGYSLEDMNFKVLFRKFAAYKRMGTGGQHFSVQLAPKAGADVPTDEDKKRVGRQLEYLSRYYGSIDVKVYWGTCQDFALDLRKRWQDWNLRKQKAAETATP